MYKKERVRSYERAEVVVKGDGKLTHHFENEGVRGHKEKNEE